MKIATFCFMFTLTFSNTNAQETGMHFEHNTSWKKVLAKAKKENKYIFVDCYTTWCGPCKLMAYSVFTKKEVGNLYNTNYINVKLQMDTVAAKDNEEIKNWYTTSHLFQQQFNVFSFPTYLVFNPNGDLADRFAGFMSVDEFIAKGTSILIPENQYYTQLRKYKAGERNPAFLYRLAMATANVDDHENLQSITNDYLATQTDLYTKENLKLIKKTTTKSSDLGFKLMLNNPLKVDSILGEKIAEQSLKWIIFNEDVGPMLPPPNGPIKPDWVNIENNLALKYPAMAKKTALYAKWFYYDVLNDLANLTVAVNETLAFDSSSFLPVQLNDFAVKIFQNSNNIGCINSAITWSKKSFENDNNYQFIDTYANLLFKAGKKQEAIDWETKAVAIAREKNDLSIGGYEHTLSEMKVKKYITEDFKQDSPIKEPD